MQGVCSVDNNVTTTVANKSRDAQRRRTKRQRTQIPKKETEKLSVSFYQHCPPRHALRQGQLPQGSLNGHTEERGQSEDRPIIIGGLLLLYPAPNVRTYTSTFYSTDTSHHPSALTPGSKLFRRGYSCTITNRSPGAPLRLTATAARHVACPMAAAHDRTLRVSSCNVPVRGARRTRAGTSKWRHAGC